MAKVLVVDDDPGLLDVLSMALEDAGHCVVGARDGALALSLLAHERFECVITDVNMPKVDGFSLCRRLRDAGNDVPIVILTSRDSEVDEALGLDLGADDYISKPFSTRVLLARIDALLRRTRLRATNDRTAKPLRCGAIEVDADCLRVTYDEVELTLTVTEFRIVETLVSHPGMVYSRDRLLELIRQDNSVVAPRIIDTYVARIRRKMQEVRRASSELETVIGAGYRWRHDG